jgi:hypothetical protein
MTQRDRQDGDHSLGSKRSVGRRSVLGSAVAAAVALAGCSSSEGDDTESTTTQTIEREVIVENGTNRTPGEYTTSDGSVDDADGTSTTSDPSVEGTVEGLDLTLGGFDQTLMRVLFQYTVSGTPEVEPLLTVTDDTGEELYAEQQVNDEPPEIEMPIEHVQDGATYTVELSYDGELVDSQTVTYEGFSLNLVSTNIDGMELRDFSSTLSERATLSLENTGDVPAYLDEAAVTVGTVELSGEFILSAEPFPPGTPREFDAYSNAELAPGEQEMVIRAKLDDRTIGQDSTTVTLAEPEETVDR